MIQNIVLIDVLDFQFFQEKRIKLAMLFDLSICRLCEQKLMNISTKKQISIHMKIIQSIIFKKKIDIPDSALISFERIRLLRSHIKPHSQQKPNKIRS